MFLAKIDMLGMSIQATFRGKTKVKSVLGGVLSLVLLSLFSVAFVFFGRDIIERQNPISNIYEIRSAESVARLSEIPLVAAAVSDYGQILHLSKEFNKAVSIKAVFNQIEGGIDNNQIRFTAFNAPLVLCTEELLGKAYFAYISSTNYSAQYFLCIDYTSLLSPGNIKISNPLLKDSYGVPNSNHLTIYLEACVETKNTGCRAALEAMGSFQFIVGLPNDILNISDSETPVFRDTKYLQTTTFVGLSFSQLINFNINELVTDEGWVFEQEHTKLFFSSGTPTYNATVFSEQDRIMGRIIFSMNMVKKVIKRRYMKVQELFANIGGFLKISMLVFSGLLRNYSKWILFNQIRVRQNRTIVEKNASGMVSTNNFVTGINLAEKKKIDKIPFYAFLKALLSSKYRTKSRIDFGKTLVCLDLDHISRQIERLEGKFENSST